MVSGVLAVLGRLWIIFLACIRGAEITPQPTLLPLATKRQAAGPRLASKQNGSTGRPINTNPTSLAAWQESKQQFLRHPSLRRSMNRQPESKLDKGKKKERLSRFVPPTFMIQDWTYRHAKDVKPPRRPPRPPSGPVPAVIVTPCTPTMSIHHDSLASETPTPAPRVSPIIYSTSNGEGITTKAITTKAAKWDRQSDRPKILDRDIAELKVDLDEDSLFNGPNSSGAREALRRSFNIPESLKGIKFESLQYGNTMLSAVSDIVCDEPSWAADTSIAERLVARAASYVTSTPAKRRLENLVEENTQAVSPLSENISYPYKPILTDAERDLLPYPDVFDIDMYYGEESHRISLPRRVQNPSTKNRRSLQVRNRGSSSTPSSESTTATGSPRSVRRFGYIPDAGHNKAMSPIHEVKRYRDHYRPPAYTCPPSQASPNTSVDSFRLGHIVKQSPQRLRTDRVLTPLPLGNVTNVPSLKIPTSSSNTTRTPRTPTTGAFPQNEPLPSPIKEITHAYPPPPIVVISHHRFSSFSLPEESHLTGSEGSQELRARLREACDNFAKSVWTDESYSMEAIALN